MSWPRRTGALRLAIMVTSGAIHLHGGTLDPAPPGAGRGGLRMRRLASIATAVAIVLVIAAPPAAACSVVKYRLSHYIYKDAEAVVVVGRATDVAPAASENQWVVTIDIERTVKGASLSTITAGTDRKAGKYDCRLFSFGPGTVSPESEVFVLTAAADGTASVSARYPLATLEKLGLGPAPLPGGDVTGLRPARPLPGPAWLPEAIARNLTTLALLAGAGVFFAVLARETARSEPFRAPEADTPSG